MLSTITQVVKYIAGVVVRAETEQTRSPLLGATETRRRLHSRDRFGTGKPDLFRPDGLAESILDLVKLPTSPIDGSEKMMH